MPNSPSSKPANHGAKEPRVERHCNEHEQVGKSQRYKMKEGLERVSSREHIRPQNSDAASCSRRCRRRRRDRCFVAVSFRWFSRHCHVVVRNRTANKKILSFSNCKNVNWDSWNKQDLWIVNMYKAVAQCTGKMSGQIGVPPSTTKTSKTIRRGLKRS